MKKFLFPAVFLFLIFPAEVLGLPTSKVTIAGNLDAGAAISFPPAAPFTFADLNASATFSTFFEVRDSLESEQTIFLYFYKIASNTWAVSAYVDGEVAGSLSGLPLQVGLLETFFFNSDGSLGNMTGARIDASISWANGAERSNFEINFELFTQLAASSAITSIENSSNLGCNALSVCVTQQYPATLANCAASASCSRPLTDFALVPGDLVSKAIVRTGCNRSFTSKSRCRSCYEKARRRLKKANSTGLFGSFIEEAMLTLKAQRDQVCR